jgi:uncharacterized caspase-like protein
MSQNWAICIGIDRYDNPQPLHFARRDAEALRDFFEKEVGFGRVYFFAEDAPPIPTDFGQPMRSSPSGGTLQRFLRVRFEQKFLKPSDNLWFFFAGHGRRERDRDYLMPCDADPGNVEETAIPVSLVGERLRRCGEGGMRIEAAGIAWISAERRGHLGNVGLGRSGQYIQFERIS